MTTEVLLAHCMDAERGLPSLPDASVDLIVTDPPYSSGGLHRRDRSLRPSEKYQTSDVQTKHIDFAHDNKDQRSFTSWQAWWMEEALRIAKPSARLIVFSDWRQLPATSDAIQWAGWIWHGIAVWEKPGGRPTMGGFDSRTEFMLWASKEALPVAGSDVYAPTLPGVLRACAPRGDDRVHMTQKPDDLLEKVVTLAPPGGLVVDPFVGSCSSGVAAVRQGRRFKGWEINPGIHQVALQRLLAAHEQLRLAI